MSLLIIGRTDVPERQYIADESEVQALSLP